MSSTVCPELPIRSFIMPLEIWEIWPKCFNLSCFLNPLSYEMKQWKRWFFVLCSLIRAEGDLSIAKVVIIILKLVNMEYSNPPSLAHLALSCSPFLKLHFPLIWTCFRLKEEYYIESDESHCACLYLLILTAVSLLSPGTEGAVFGHSVETPHIRAEPSQDLR